MSNYRRLISYIYAYEGGVKGKNIGFAKLEARNGQCRISVNVKKVYVGGSNMGVYILAGKSEILLGNIFIRNGAGEFRCVVQSSDVEHSGISLDECYGLTVHETDSAWRAYTTIWEDAVARAAEVDLEDITSQNQLIRQRQAGNQEQSSGAISENVMSVVAEIEREIAADGQREGAENEDLPADDSLTLPESMQPVNTPITDQPVHIDQPEYQETYTGSVPVMAGPAGCLNSEGGDIKRLSGITVGRYRPLTPGPYASPACQDMQPSIGAGAAFEAQTNHVQSDFGIGAPVASMEGESDETDASGVPSELDVQGEAGEPSGLGEPSGSSVLSELGVQGEAGVPSEARVSGESVMTDASAVSGAADGFAADEPEPVPVPLTNPKPSEPSFGDSSALEQLEREEQEENSHEKLWEYLRKMHTKLPAFDYEYDCEILTIKPQDIGLLPREVWIYGNNSFLLHGYYNYRYLVLVRLMTKQGTPRYLLGVPGHYYSNEKYMASMFGFSNFVLAKQQPAEDGRFGYWYTDVRLGD